MREGGRLKPIDPNGVISEQPGYLLRRMFQIAEAYFADEATGLDLTSAQYGVLTIIGARPGIDQLRLSQATRWDRTTVSGVVTRVNAELEKAPELVNEDPWGKGWMIAIRPSRLGEEQAALLDAAGYRQHLDASAH